MPNDKTAFSDREREVIEQIAQQRGVTFEEAAEELAKEGLANRIRRKTGKAPARVYELPKRKQ